MYCVLWCYLCGKVNFFVMISDIKYNTRACALIFSYCLRPHCQSVIKNTKVVHRYILHILAGSLAGRKIWVDKMIYHLLNKGVFTTNQWMTIRKSKDDRKQHNHGSSVHYCFQYKSTLSTEKKALSLSFVLEQFEEHFPDSESNKIVMLERFHHYNNVGMFVLT